MKNLLLLLSFVLGSSFHPYYLSVTELRYSENEKALQGSVKLFVNDLENAVKKTGHPKVDLINGAQKETNEILQDYLERHLHITLNGSRKKVQMIGYEQEAENLYLYIQVTECEKPERIVIENSLLYDFLPEQINIVQVEAGTFKSSQKMINPEKTFIFQL